MAGEHSGSVLRQARQSVGVGLSRIAYQGRLSVSHLSRVERGERPVTPAIVAAYQRAIGVRRVPVPAPSPLAALAGGNLLDHHQIQDADQAARRRLRAAMAAVAVGGPLPEPVDNLLQRAGDGRMPARVGIADVLQIEQAQDMFTASFLRYGGGLTARLIGGHLRCAVGLRDATMTAPVAARLHTAIGALALRAAWAMFDAGWQPAAFDLFQVALYAAGRAGDADLRAAVLGDLATQYYYLGQVEDSLAVARLAAGDERVCPAVRCLLHTVNARGHATRGDAAETTRQIGLAEQAFAEVTAENTPVWMTRLLCAAQMQALTGQAAFLLARGCGTTAGNPVHVAQAYTRLGYAAANLDPVRRARAVVVCTTRLAALHLAEGQLGEAVRVGRQAVAVARDVRSVPIKKDLRALRAEAVTRARDTLVRAFIGEIDELLTPPAQPSTNDT